MNDGMVSQRILGCVTLCSETWQMPSALIFKTKSDPPAFQFLDGTCLKLTYWPIVWRGFAEVLGKACGQGEWLDVVLRVSCAEAGLPEL